MELKSNGIIGQSASLAGVFKILGKVAPTDSTVLVTGESGTGKELLVRALHAASPRADRPFVPVNCGAIPRDLLESELFGHEKGAFTHALRSRPGRFELADGGTIFLDEIGEMEPGLQVKILRVLQEKEIERVGGTGCRKVDVRIVAATNRDLEAAVAAGTFREDLYYRLNVIPIHLPPLRERGQDVLLLARHFLGRFCRKKERPPLELSPVVQRVLLAYAWPGNVRELENVCTFYKTMHRLPDYLFSEDPGEPAQADMSGSYMKILELIEKNTELSHGIGRVNLVYQLRSQNCYVSDHKLRLILGELREKGLITLKPGRCGTQITEKGTALLRRSEKISGKKNG